MSLFRPNTEELGSKNEREKFLLIWRLSLILSVLFFVATLLTYSVDFYSSILYVIALMVCLFCFLFLTFVQETKPIFWIFSISASAIVTFSMQTLMGTLHYPDFIWAVATIVFAFIGLGNRIGIFFLIFHIVSISIFFGYTINLHLDQLKPIPFQQQMSVLFEMLVGFFALTYLIKQYRQYQTYTETQLLEANLKLNHKNEEISLLMKEIHHRIKNNLQLIISMLRMQSQEIDSEEAKKHFSEAISRIVSISIIHQKLYQNEDLKNFKFEDYVGELVREIQFMCQRNDVKVELTIDAPEIGLKTLIPLGLLLNELITNSFKHAFNESQSNNVIEIHIEPCGASQICLYYEDSGIWNEPFTRGFGLELIELLSSQLEGHFERQGSSYKFKLSNLDLE